ncbi:hypothetical protein [Nocardia suismassiliense]|uniref:hypothetical protein n=1 Tax=Nocardia suismassiliense TaxID=2077092 RepID=UPI000D1D6214|nr:hypothetical protein [Nocardia suismassiliense]
MEYIEQWERHLVAAPAAAVLSGAGWVAANPPIVLDDFRIDTAGDAHDLLALTPEQWGAAGWGASPSWSPWRFDPAGAARLADAGITSARARALAEAGHCSVEAMLCATPPAVPQDATRIIITPQPDPIIGAPAFVTTDPALARGYLDRFPELWDATITADHATVVPVEPRGWALTADGELVAGHWIDSADEAPPQSLPPAAVAALTLMAGACNRDELIPDTRHWHPLRTALTHHSETVGRRSIPELGWTRDCWLHRHRFTLPDACEVIWWQVRYCEGGMSGADGQVVEYSVHADTARTALHTPH